jgi:phosphotransferase system enzyme I (PtsI)
MVTAAAELQALAASAPDRAGAEILEFQIALLDDEDLLAPIFDRIAGGEPADAAWQENLDTEIGVYRAGDEVIEARVIDLADLRDRVLDALSPGPQRAVTVDAEQALYVAEDLTPSRFLETDWSRFRGAAIKGGSAGGHVALLARARGTPLLIGLGDDFQRVRDGALALLHAERGQLVLDPSPGTLGDFKRRLANQQAASAAVNVRFLERPAITANGERVHVLINVDDPALLAAVDPRHTDGIGLTRTEFLFRGPDLPDEARQYRAYAEILKWAAGRPVIIRTLDAGGDKPIAGLTPEHESNPFLGLRGLRLSLARPEVITVQLRALARAAVGGQLKVMAPMVTIPAEFDAFRQLFEEAVDGLTARGVEAAVPSLGMMVEVPAAALRATDFDADFMSIGSNDLIQYVMAAGRDIRAVADLYDPRNPAVLELIERVVDVGRRRGVEVSLCGDMASEPDLVPQLLGLGLRRLSVAPTRLGAVKAAIAAWRQTGRRPR